MINLSSKTTSQVISLCRAVINGDITGDMRVMAFDLALELSRGNGNDRQITFADGEVFCVPAHVIEKVSEILQAGPTQKITAIKALREATGMGLREAKDCVESPKVFRNAIPNASCMSFPSKVVSVR